MSYFEDRADGSKWFSEYSTMWPGQAMRLEVDKVIYEGKTKFQDLLIFQSKTYGKVMVLDGAIQSTERDEFAYHEMLAHIPAFSHPEPKKALVIGGGDGGIVRELIKHDTIEEVTLCDIDEGVINQSKEMMKHLAVGFDSPKCTIHIGDGFEFLKAKPGTFDIIIVDSSDPIGPAHTLFEKPFYSLLHDALREGGIVATQGECLWLHLDLIKGMSEFCRELYPTVQYAYTTIPTYPSGQIGFMLCSKGQSLKEPRRTPSEAMQNGLQYYNPEVHRAAFVLPQFAKKELGPILTE